MKEEKWPNGVASVAMDIFALRRIFTVALTPSLEEV